MCRQLKHFKIKIIMRDRTVSFWVEFPTSEMPFVLVHIWIFFTKIIFQFCRWSKNSCDILFITFKSRKLYNWGCFDYFFQDPRDLQMIFNPAPFNFFDQDFSFKHLNDFILARNFSIIHVMLAITISQNRDFKIKIDLLIFDDPWSLKCTICFQLDIFPYKKIYAIGKMKQ